MTDDDDCLHCEIWRVIRTYNERHKNLQFDDVMAALADVVGDNIWIAGKTGDRERTAIIERIDKRTAWRKKHGGIKRG